MSNIFKRYYKTRELCIYLSCSKTFLNERKGIVFFKGIHYFIPPTESKFLVWDILEIEKWLRSEKQETRDIDIEELMKKVL